MPRLSRYNHFQPWRDGYYIAYNALAGTVALMTEHHYKTFEKIRGAIEAGEEVKPESEERALYDQLVYGRYICDHDYDERQLIKFQQNRERYDQTNLGLTIAPTLACNMACQYCYEGNKSGRMTPEVMDATVKLAEAEAPQLRSLGISWYGGEPLLAMDIIRELTARFRELAKKYEFAYGASMISNGYLLTPDRVDELVALDVTGCQVTVDGPEDIHNTKRPLKNGKPSYATIMENLTYAATKIRIGLRINVDKGFTRDIIGGLLDDFTASGLQKKISVHFGHIEAFTDACANISESCHNIREFSETEVEYCRLLYDRGFKIDMAPMPKSVFCMAQRINAFLIAPDGEMYRCFHHTGNPALSTGNIRDEIDYKHHNFMRMFTFDPLEDETCSACTLLPVCIGGCPSQRIDRNLQSDEICQSWKYNLTPMLEIIALVKQQEMQAQTEEAKLEEQTVERE